MKFKQNETKNGYVIFGIIYSINNKINGKLYIGQTTRNLNNRIYEYKTRYKNNTFHNNYLGNAFKKYGWDNFEFITIDIARTLEELNNLEMKYIHKHKSNQRKFGYNIHSGGRNAIPNKETIEKMSQSHKGMKQTYSWTSKRIAKAGTEEAKKYGKKKTKNEKLYLSENSVKYWQGKSRSEETKIKISETKKLKGLSPKQKEAICKVVYKIDQKTKKIEIFESTSYAAKIQGVDQSTISRWCKNQKTIGQFLWKYSK